MCVHSAVQAARPCRAAGAVRPDRAGAYRGKGPAAGAAPRGAGLPGLRSRRPARPQDTVRRPARRRPRSRADGPGGRHTKVFVNHYAIICKPLKIKVFHRARGPWRPPAAGCRRRGCRSTRPCRPGSRPGSAARAPARPAGTGRRSWGSPAAGAAPEPRAISARRRDGGGRAGCPAAAPRGSGPRRAPPGAEVAAVRARCRVVTSTDARPVPW